MTARNGKKPQVHQTTGLTPAQEIAIASILAGQSQAEAANAAGVRAEQISRWKRDDPEFMAELNRRTLELWESNRLELLALAAQARGALRDLLASDNERIRLQAAQAVLRAQLPPGNLTTTAQGIRRQREMTEIMEAL